MNNPNAYGYEQPMAQPREPAPGQSGGSLPSQYKFSPDELRVLGECNRDSFFQRSVPIGTILGLGTFVAVQNGHLKPNPRFGAFPKMALAVTVGYFLGKLSYQQACAEKLMNLPGSYIGQLLRDRKEGRFGSGFGGASPPSPSAPMFGAGPKDIYSDAGPGSSLDLDTDRPIFSGDDTYRPDSPGPTNPGPEALPKGPALSYDDLRRRNRGDYVDSKQDPYRTEQLAPTPPVERSRPAPPPTSRATNKYGDDMD